MRLRIISFLLSLLSVSLNAQNFQIIDRQEQYQAGINEVVRIPIRIKNTSDKAQFYIIRKEAQEMGNSQKGYFCLDKNCLDPTILEFSKKVEAGETLQGLYFVVETGLQSAQNNLNFEVFVKGKPQDVTQISTSLVVADEKPSRSVVFQSRELTIHQLFPNPVQNEAFMDYQLHGEQTKAKIVIHNILGKPMGEYDLQHQETRLKIQADDLTSGIYFYTVYLDNTGVATRKMIVRK